ncbi:MAG: hypothetical protein GX862_05645 [Leucobacter sp.]|nr:hypothetical protein [Leucobacter sp.]
MTAFATYQELEKRMSRTFTTTERVWVTELLEDSAEYMRGIIGQQVYPPQQITFQGWPDRGWVDLPATVVRSVDAVTFDGQPVEWEQRLGSVRVGCNGPVAVTVSVGFSVAPRDLIALNCALVSSQLLLVEAGLGLQLGGLSSVAIDDFKVAFADAGERTGGMSLPDHQQEYLRNRYGVSVFTTRG